jgi:hypothetical protein
MTEIASGVNRFASGVNRFASMIEIVRLSNRSARCLFLRKIYVASFPRSVATNDRVRLQVMA